MKTARSIIVLILVVIGGMCLAHCQDNVSVSIHQDGRLFFVGDDKGNEAVTPNVLLRFNLKCKQDKIGYGFIFPEVEFADLQGGDYYRYSLNGGYTFNQITPNLEASLTGGYGLIHRNGLAYRSFGCSGILSYKLGRFSPSLILQGVDRTDINKFGISGFFGLEYNFK